MNYNIKSSCPQACIKQRSKPKVRERMTGMATFSLAMLKLCQTAVWLHDSSGEHCQLEFQKYCLLIISWYLLRGIIYSLKNTHKCVSETHPG